MENSNYNPEKLVYNYRSFEHGKAKINAIRAAVKQADDNNDIPYMIFFRKELCSESSWYSDGLEVITVFPELLALIDKYPDAGLTCFWNNQPDNIKPVLWCYELLLSACVEFYQVSMEDCIKFLNDFLHRWTAYGHDAKEPYRMMVEFYIVTGDMESASKAFHNFKQYNGKDYYCEPACAANTEINYYLHKNKKEKADKISKDIINSKITSYNYETNALLRMKSNYMEYYILDGNYKKAAECANILEHSDINTTEFKQWMSFACAYVHSKPGYSLDIYKRHWKEWQNEHNPWERYYIFRNMATLFRGLQQEKSTDITRLDFDSTFPLYNKSTVYSICSLTEYYYKEAEEIAKKFDKRNGTDKFTKELEKSFANVYLSFPIF